MTSNNLHPQVGRPGAGESFVNAKAMPGLALIALAVAAVPASLAAVAYMDMSAGWVAVISALLAVTGVLWLVSHHRRLLRTVEMPARYRWTDSDVPVRRPADITRR